MKKIKTSLELAMEKFGIVRESEQELAKRDEEKYLKAAATLGNSFLEKKTDMERIRETLERYPENIRAETKQIFTARLVEALNPGNMPEILEAISYVKNDPKTKKICDEAAASIMELQEWLEKEKTEYENNVQSGMIEDLAREGFRGSALAGVNIKDSKKWQEKTGAFTAEYEKIIAKFKEASQ